MKEKSKRLLYVPTKFVMVGVKYAHYSLRFMVYKPCPTIGDEGGTRTHDLLLSLLLYVTIAKRDAKIILPFGKNLLLGTSLFVVVWDILEPYWNST